MILAAALSEEGLSLGRELGDQRVIAAALDTLGEAAYAQHDFTWRQELFEESLRLHRTMGNKVGMNGALTRLAWGLSVEGDYQRGNLCFRNAWRCAGSWETAGAWSRHTTGWATWHASEVTSSARRLPMTRDWPYLGSPRPSHQNRRAGLSCRPRQA
jgi:hypothetical protein